MTDRYDELVSHLAPCVFHDHDHAACQGYSGQVPCMTQTESDWLAEKDRELAACSDYAADQATCLERVAKALGVPAEPHQGRAERIIEAAESLATHVERLHRLWRATDDCEEGSEEQLTLFGELDEATREFHNNPATSRRLKAQWQAEILGELRVRHMEDTPRISMDLRAYRMRRELLRQAEGDE